MTKWYGALLLAQYYQGLEYVAATVAAIILLSSLDDLFIDAWYWTREAYRALTVRRQHAPLSDRAACTSAPSSRSRSWFPRGRSTT